MDRKLITSQSVFEKEIGYSRAVTQGEWIFVSGTSGFNYTDNTISEDVAEQAEQCLKNIKEALNQTNAELSDIVRVNYILPNKIDFKKCWPVLRKYFGEILPAATMWEAGLIDDRMKIEIEVTALRRT